MPIFYAPPPELLGSGVWGEARGGRNNWLVSLAETFENTRLILKLDRCPQHLCDSTVATPLPSFRARFSGLRDGSGEV